MSAPIDILLNPLPNLVLHTAFFIAALIIMILWINGTVENPWSPTIIMVGFALFNLLLAAIRYKTSSDDDPNPPANTTEGEDEDVEGGHEVNQQENHQPAKGSYHTGGSPRGKTLPMGTTYPATESPQVASVEELAKKPANITDRLSTPKKPDIGDMEPNVNFSPQE